jgi:hypothetical protein
MAWFGPAVTRHFPTTAKISQGCGAALPPQAIREFERDQRCVSQTVPEAEAEGEERADDTGKEYSD